MTDDERYGQVYGAALGRAVSEVCDWLKGRRRRVPPSLETALSYVERVGRVGPEPTDSFCRAAEQEATIRLDLVHELVDLLISRGHLEVAERLAIAAEHIDPEARGIHASFVRGLRGHRTEALETLAGVARDKTRLPDARRTALECVNMLGDDGLLLELAVQLLADLPAHRRDLVTAVAELVAHAYRITWPAAHPEEAEGPLHDPGALPN